MTEQTTDVHRRLRTSILKETGFVQQAMDIISGLPGIIDVKVDDIASRLTDNVFNVLKTLDSAFPASQQPG